MLRAEHPSVTKRDNSPRERNALSRAGQQPMRPVRRYTRLVVRRWRTNRAVSGVGVVPTLLFAVLDEKEVVMGPAESIRELVEPLVTAAGLECWDVESSAGIVRVLVDRPGGVDLDALGPLTQLISATLDDHDVVPGGRYQLEVSSPGVERTLRTPAQYRRFIGSLLSIKTAVAVDGQRRFQGVLTAADDDSITIEVGDSPLRLTYHDIQKAHTVLVWGPTPKPGQHGRRAASGSVPMKETAS
jgi:ribosome maturation factor RimP